MRKKWSQGSLDYIQSLVELGRTLGRHAALAKSSDYQKFKAFGGELQRGARTALQDKSGNATLSTEPNLVFEAQLGKGLPEEGRTEIVIGGKSRFSDGVLSEQAINLIILFTPYADVGNLKAGRTYVVRKIHFDFDRENVRTSRPTSHMQVGGKIAEAMIAHVGDSESVEHETFDQIDIPRIPSPPFGLASVLDMALREFAPPSLQALTGEVVWNDLVSRTETLLLSNYHGRLHEELRGRGNRTNYAFHCSESVCDM